MYASILILIRCMLYYKNKLYAIKMNLPQYFQLVICEREDDYQAETLHDELPQFLSKLESIQLKIISLRRV